MRSVFHIGIGTARAVKSTHDRRTHDKNPMTTNRSSSSIGPAERSLTAVVHREAQPHTAEAIKVHVRTRDVLPQKWPASSPDLNPITNVWNYVQRAIVATPPPLHTRVERRSHT